MIVHGEFYSALVGQQISILLCVQNLALKSTGLPLAFTETLGYAVLGQDECSQQLKIGTIIIVHHTLISSS